MAAPLEFATDRIALRKRELRFMFALSAAFHGSIVALLVTSPFSLSRTPVALLPAVISVDLVAAPAAARPAPKPVPETVKVAEPAKPRPIVKKTVLPKEARLDPEKAKPKPKPRRKPELAPDPKPAVQEKYVDVMAQLRAGSTLSVALYRRGSLDSISLAGSSAALDQLAARGCGF